MSKKKPRIAIVHYSCPPVIGGVEFVIEAHARLFADAGYKVKLMVGKGGKVHPKVRTIVIPELVSTGGSVGASLKALSEGKVPSSFEADVKRVEKKLSTALRDVDVCVMHNVLSMHFNLILTAALANIMGRSRRIRFIGWNHDSTFGDPNYSAHQRAEYPWSLLTQELPGCNYCVISAQRQKELGKIFKIPASRLPVMPNGVDVPGLLGFTAMVREIFYAERLNETDIVALTPTRIVRRKNLEAGIEIVAELKKLGKSVRWIITGAPDPHNTDAMEYYDKLISLRRELRVEKEVIFMCERFKERISNKDLHALFAVSDMLIFPSKQEGFGIPALEGGLAGLVMVLSDIPVLREIAGTDAVYIHDGEDPAVVAGDALQALERSPRLIFRKKVMAQYSWSSIFADKIEPFILM